MDKKTFFKVTLPGEDYGYVCTLKEAQILLEQIVKASIEHDDDSSYEFSLIYPTEEEFKNLPPFQGF